MNILGSNLTKSILFSLTISSLQAMETIENDHFPSEKYAPTIAQIETAHKNRWHNGYRYPDLEVGSIQFTQGRLGVPFNPPFAFESSYINFDGFLCYTYKGSRGEITYESDVLKEDKLKTWGSMGGIFGPCLEEEKIALEKRSHIIKDSILRWSDIFKLASKKEVWLGEYFNGDKEFYRKKLPSLNENAFINVKFVPLNRDDSVKIRHVANFIVQNYLDLEKSLYPKSFTPTYTFSNEDQSLDLRYDINVDGVGEIWIKKTVQL